LSSLKEIKKLGEGTYGKVYLVKPSQSKGLEDVYALKVMSKQSIYNDDMTDNIQTEKALMERLHHPFILQLKRTFQDSHNVYMLLDYIRGGEMKDVMSSFDKERMPSGPSSFYAANIMEGLSHLHQYKIGHRDIKPENIMIGSDGYCLLIDLGLGKYNIKYCRN